MARKERYLVGLDVGTSKVTAVVGEMLDDDGLDVVGLGVAESRGIRRGDIILAVNNQDVKSLEQFGQLMNQFEKGKVVAMLVRRGANALYIPFRIE